MPAAELLLFDFLHNARCCSCFITIPSFLPRGGNGDVDGDDDMSLFAFCCCCCFCRTRDLPLSRSSRLLLMCLLFDINSACCCCGCDCLVPITLVSTTTLSLHSLRCFGSLLEDNGVLLLPLLLCISINSAWRLLPLPPLAVAGVGGRVGEEDAADFFVVDSCCCTDFLGVDVFIGDCFMGDVFM